MATTIKIEYQLTNSGWVSCSQPGQDDRTEEFLAFAMSDSGMSREEVIAALAVGPVRIGDSSTDWIRIAKGATPVATFRAMRGPDEYETEE